MLTRNEFAENLAAFASTVSEAWPRMSTPHGFSRVACELLSDWPAERWLTVENLQRFLMDSDDMPLQAVPDVEANRFPLRLYCDPEQRFVLDLYCWVRSITPIHNHRVPGAFRVVSGSALISEYRFREDQTPHPSVGIGELSIDRLVETRPGMCFELLPSQGLIHQVCHLAVPSLSLLLTAPHAIGSIPQRNYYSPGFALSFRDMDSQLYSKRVRMLRFLEQTGDPGARAYHERLLTDTDLVPGLQYFFTGFVPGRPLPLVDHAIELLKKTHGDYLEVIRAPAYDLLARTEVFVQRAVDHPTRRFLALLHTAGFGPETFKVLQAAYPDRPVRDTVKAGLRRAAVDSLMHRRLAAFAHQQLESGNRFADMAAAFPAHGIEAHARTLFGYDRLDNQL